MPSRFGSPWLIQARGSSTPHILTLVTEVRRSWWMELRTVVQLLFVPDLYVSRKPSPSLLFMFCEGTKRWEDVTQWSVSSVRENGVSDGSVKGVRCTPRGKGHSAGESSGELEMGILDRAYSNFVVKAHRRLIVPKAMSTTSSRHT